jgi:hypothetical protein
MIFISFGVEVLPMPKAGAGMPVTGLAISL